MRRFSFVAMVGAAMLLSAFTIIKSIDLQITEGYSLKFKGMDDEGIFKTMSGVLNTLISILSFASIIGPIGMSLPLDIEFPGLVVPMHFFPALIFFAIAPFFTTKTNSLI